MSDNRDHDPCADFLDAPPSAAGDIALQERLFRQTTRMIRRRRWLRRAGFAAAFAACYLAGAVTVYLVRSPAPPQPGTVPLPSPPSTASPGETTVGLTAVALENQALDSVQPQPELYRLAGDRYVAESGDLQAALRCYRQALDEGPEQDLQVKPEDSWLLIALKEARQKEKENAKHDD
jgi:hypothetical protein